MTVPVLDAKILDDQDWQNLLPAPSPLDAQISWTTFTKNNPLTTELHKSRNTIKQLNSVQTPAFPIKLQNANSVTHKG